MTDSKKKSKSRKSRTSEKAVTKTVNKVLRKKGLKPELKLFDNTLTVTNLPKSDGPAYSTLLNNIPGGSSESQRDGNIIFQKRLRFKMTLAPKHIPAIGQTANGGDNSASMVAVRVMLVMDRQTISDTTPALSDVLASTLSNDLPIISPQTILQQKRFKILYDKVKFCEVTKNYHLFSKVIKVNKDIVYNGTANTDIQKNGIYLFAWYNDYGVPTSGTDVNDGPRFTYWARSEYTDC